MPAPPMTATSKGERPRAGTTISRGADNQAAQQPVPGEWQHPPGQLCGVFDPWMVRSDPDSPLVGPMVSSSCPALGAISRTRATTAGSIAGSASDFSLLQKREHLRHRCNFWRRANVTKEFPDNI